MLGKIQRALFGDPEATRAERARLAAELADLDARRANLTVEADALQAQEDREAIERAQQALAGADAAIRREHERKQAAAESERAQALKATREQFARLDEELAAITVKVTEAGEKIGALEREARDVLLGVLEAGREAARVVREMQAARARMTSLGASPDALPPEVSGAIHPERRFYQAAGIALEREVRAVPMRTIAWSALREIADRAQNYRN